MTPASLLIASGAAESANFISSSSLGLGPFGVCARPQLGASANTNAVAQVSIFIASPPVLKIVADSLRFIGTGSCKIPHFILANKPMVFHGVSV